jgi:predicted Zn-dependent peptidase
MHEDDPEDVVTNLFADLAWGSATLGRPIAGTTESIGSLTRAQILRYSRAMYRAENIVVSVSARLTSRCPHKTAGTF